MTKLIADQFFQDKRVAEAKQTLVEALKEHQKKIVGVLPPQLDLIVSYEELIQQFSLWRGGNLFYPYIGSGLGRGAFVELADGSIKYDFITGIGVHFFGHSNPKIVEVCLDSALTDTVMQGNLQQNRDSITLTQLLLESSGLDHCFLSTTGVMANENGLKVAFHKRQPARRLLAFEGCFMGRTITLSHVTDKPAYREGIPSTISVDYVPFFDAQNPQASTKKAVEVLKTHIKRHPNKYAAMCFELIQGEAGFKVGDTDFFKALMEILKDNDIAVLIDEVQTFGRTHQLFAFQHFGLEEYVDIVTIGKLSHACATLYRGEFIPKPGLLSQTFTASTAAIRTSTALINHLREGGYYGPNGKNVHLHNLFADKLKDLEEKYPEWIEGPWGLGVMIAFTPFGGKPEWVVHFAKELFSAGVICFTAGSKTMRIRFLIPAIAISDEDIENAMQIIEETLITVGEQI